jgi:hypothetical protein
MLAKRRIAGYTLAGLAACALVTPSAGAARHIDGAKLSRGPVAAKPFKQAESARRRTGRRRACGKRCR